MSEVVRMGQTVPQASVACVTSSTLTKLLRRPGEGCRAVDAKPLRLALLLLPPAPSIASSSQTL